MPWLSRSWYRLLNRDRVGDYGFLFVIGMLPILCAWSFGADQSWVVNGQRYVGFLDKSNFWPLALVTPLTLWLLRLECGRIATISSPNLPSEPPALIHLFEDEAQKETAYQIMRAYMGAPRVMGIVLFLAIGITALDTLELAGVYLYDTPVRVGEHDWTVMFKAGLVTRMQNLALVILAYSMQFLITGIGIACVAFMLFHNLYFLDRIYQRSSVDLDEADPCIKINLEDVNKCFGFRIANAAFNTQVIVLLIGGCVVLISRFASVGELGEGATLMALIESPRILLDVVIFPDIGQVLLAVFWLLALLIVSLPAFVKLLPRLPGRGENPPLTITNYLREFLADDQWPYGETPTKRDIEYMAAKFAENSFWPTGDNRAGQLFFYSIFIFLFILYPIKTPDLPLLLASMAAMAVIAYLLRGTILSMLNSSLSFVDERLTRQQPELIREIEKQHITIRSKVFISYRREDSAPFTRLLLQSLARHMDREEIFVDIETIHDGDDFVKSIENAISNCDVVLVVIGKQWANCTAENGEKRLFQESDFVRLEIAAAIRQERVVIPVLVGGAVMPGAAELPLDLEPLSRRHARELSDTRWEYDTEQLARVIAE
jgi:hypothetical protein